MSDSFSSKYQQRKQAKRELINQDFSGSKVAYYCYIIGYWFLGFILMAVRAGFIPFVAVLGIYWLVFYLIGKKARLNVWISIFIAFFVSILSVITLIILTASMY